MTKTPLIYINTLNVRTLTNEERLQELENALSFIKWDILGLAEIRRNKEAIIVRKETGNIFCHGEAKNGQYGVGFLIKSKWKENIIEYKTISERIATLRLEIENKNKTIVQVHAPTSERPLEEVESFYNTLEDIIVNSKMNNSRLVLMGDLNSKIGKQERGEESVIGKSHYGTRNERGQKLIDFASQFQLKIGNSYYTKSSEQKWTWISPSGYKNEIDFILIQSLNNIQNIEIINRFHFISDHRMVRMTMKVNGKRNRKHLHKKSPKSTDIIEQKEKYVTKLSEYVNNTTQIFSTLEVQDMYNILEKAITQAASELEADKEKQKSKFSEETPQLIKDRTSLGRKKNKTAREKIQLAELRKLVKKYIRKDIKHYEEEIIINTINENISTKKMRKNLSPDTHWIPKLQSRNKIECERTNILETATKYYSELYSSENAEFTESQPVNEINSIPPFLTEEIEKVVKELKNNKCPGEDNILNEIIKTGLEVITTPLQQLFNKILKTKKIPNQWRSSQIILLYKKGDKTNISNYRPISLVSTICKIFTKLIQSRLKNILEAYQPEEQVGFRRNKSTLNNLQTVNQLIEKANEYNIELFLCFVDFNKAFDSLEHSSIWEALEEAGVEKDYIDVIKELYKDNTARIKLERKGKSFNIKRGVRQGDPLSPDLFNCVLENKMKKLQWEEKKFGIRINGKYLSNLRFADDVIIIAKSSEELTQQIKELTTECSQAGLSINKTKTKVITNSEEIPIELENSKIEYAKDYLYLGQIISFKNKDEKEVNARINSAWKKYWSLKEIFKNKKISLPTKRRIFDICVSPTLTYGCQTWAISEKTIRKIKVCQNKMLRSLLNITWKDKMTLEEIYSRTKVADVTRTIKSLKWSWAGHMVRKNEGWDKLSTEWIPIDKKRKVGRQKTRWADDIRKIAGITWETKGRNRVEWYRLGEIYNS